MDKRSRDNMTLGGGNPQEEPPRRVAKKSKRRFLWLALVTLLALIAVVLSVLYDRGETAAVFSSDREVVAEQLAAENTHTLIDVFCISPGAIETPMFYSSTLKNMSPEERKAFDAAQAKKRLIQPSEIAFWLGELLRDESTLFHGANIDATMGLGTRPGIQTEAGLEHN